MTESPVESVKQGGVVEDLLEVLWSPAAVFERARNSNGWKYLGVLIVLCTIVAVATIGLLQPYLEATADLQVTLQRRAGVTISEQTVAIMRTTTRYVYMAGPIFLLSIGALLGAVFVVLAGKTLNAPLQFGQAFRILAISSAPRLFGYIASPAMAAGLDASNARSMADLTLGAARFTDPYTISPVLQAFLTTMDVFALWQYVLIAIGVSVVARVERSTGAMVSLMSWGLGAALTLVPGMIMS